MKNVVILILLLFLSACCSTEETHEFESDFTNTLLLKDYRPKSLHKVQCTNIEKAKFSAIDIHTHAYAKSKKELDIWVGIMNEVGIEKAIVLTGATGSEFDNIFKLYSNYPNLFEIWCGIDFSGYGKPNFQEKAIKELERCVKIGATGVGKISDKGNGMMNGNMNGKAIGIHPNDSLMDPIFKKCEELNLPVNIHIADPIWMYHEIDSTNDGLMNSYYWHINNTEVEHQDLIEILKKTLERHPGTEFIACHFAGLSHDFDQLEEILDTYNNVWVDNSARYFETSVTPRRTDAFYKKYSDRILFGTDMGKEKNMYHIIFRILESADEHFYAFEYDFVKTHWALYGLDLSNEILEKIYKKNALKLLNEN